MLNIFPKTKLQEDLKHLKGVWNLHPRQSGSQVVCLDLPPSFLLGQYKYFPKCLVLSGVPHLQVRRDFTTISITAVKLEKSPSDL